MKKILTIIGFFFIFYFLLRILLVGKVPNSISLQEITLLKSVNYFPDFNNFSFRIFNVFVAGLISALTGYLVYKKTINNILSVSVALVLFFSPWLFIVSSFLNLYLIPLLLIIFLIIILPNKTYSLFISIILLFIFRLFFVSSDLSTIRPLLFIPDLIRLFDLRVLFFHGDPISPMMKIPLTGFFYYIDLLAFFSGISYLFFITKNLELKKTISYIFILGITSYLILPADLYADMLMTTRGELVFLLMSIIIGLGYYYLFGSLKKINILFVFGLIFIMIANFLFTSELLLNHFDKKNSSEWSYAEQSTANYLMNNKDKPVYMTNQSNKLYRFLDFFKKENMKASEATIDEMRLLCINPNVICIVKEEELHYFNIQKDDSKEKFGNFDGLPTYFVLPSK